MKRFASIALASLLTLSVIVSGAAIFNHDISQVGDVPATSGSASAGAGLNQAIIYATTAAGPSAASLESSTG